MRDLLGFDLKLSEDLPADPIKPYHFNNNAGMMMIGRINSFVIRKQHESYEKCYS